MIKITNYCYIMDENRKFNRILSNLHQMYELVQNSTLWPVSEISTGSKFKQMETAAVLDFVINWALYIIKRILYPNSNARLETRTQLSQTDRASAAPQYVKGIHDNPMIFKSRLRVTQGHWKRHHWVDHTRLTISRVI